MAPRLAIAVQDHLKSSMPQPKNFYIPSFLHFPGKQLYPQSWISPPSPPRPGCPLKKQQLPIEVGWGIWGEGVQSYLRYPRD